MTEYQRPRKHIEIVSSTPQHTHPDITVLNQDVIELSTIVSDTEDDVFELFTEQQRILQAVAQLSENDTWLVEQVRAAFAKLNARIKELETQNADRDMILLAIAATNKNVALLFKHLGLQPRTPLDDVSEKINSVTPFTQASQADDTPDMADTLSGVSSVDTLFQSQDFRRDVQIYNKPQLAKKYGVSESTIVRVKRLLRDQGYNI